MTDKITWHISPQTLKTDARANIMKRLIVEACPEVDPRDAGSFALILSCTNGVDFDAATARPALKTFKAALERVRDMDGAALWAFREDMPLQLWYAWISAYNDGQELFDTDPAELPTTALSDEQKAEAAQPDSPLAAPAQNSPAA